MTTATIFDDRICTLGEGALWHPGRQQLFWFDIMGQRLLSRTETGEALSWQFDESVSAAGWVDKEHLLIASETALRRFNLHTGKSERLCDLEADNSVTRSNDGRADPWGGFWIGTMGKQAETGAGAIYRFYRGQLRQLFAALTIPNAICFAPDGRVAYFADTSQDTIWRQPLDQQQGWPLGEPEVFIDCSRAGVHPDGAVTDSRGYLWNAQWGSSRVACYNPQGEFQFAVPFPAQQISCPAFGGADLSTLFATSATENLSEETLSRQTDAGKTFSIDGQGTGKAENQVILAVD